MPFSRSDAGVVFQGDTKINSQGHMISQQELQNREAEVVG